MPPIFHPNDLVAPVHSRGVGLAHQGIGVGAKAAVEATVTPLARAELGGADDALQREPGLFQCALLGDVLRVRGCLDSLHGRVLEQVGPEHRRGPPPYALAASLWPQPDPDLPAECLGTVVAPPVRYPAGPHRACPCP